MKGERTIYYDDEADFLEITTGTPVKGYFKDIGEGIAERIDEKTGNVIGIAILSFKKRTQNLKNLKISFPLHLEIKPLSLD